MRTLIHRKSKTYLPTILIIFLITMINRFIIVPGKIKITPTVSLTPLVKMDGSAELISVKRVVDGDTIELENKKKVRYIGINSPELHDPRKPVECFAKEAMLKNRELVEGKIVRLEKDVSETDKYSRLLRYVYLPATASSSGMFINAEMVKQGYAYADTFPPDVKYSDLFRNLQKEAEINNRGLWKICK